MHPTPDTT
uniref:Uncharacterized protein n=1 Tax=Anguilla anguilla TaxID=7936 RepID=A0A0E9V861_ANGAN